MTDRIDEKDLPQVSPAPTARLRAVQNGKSVLVPLPDVVNASALIADEIQDISAHGASRMEQAVYRAQIDADAAVNAARQQIASEIAGLGRLPAVEYEEGLVVDSYFFTVMHDGNRYAPRSVPFTTGAVFDEAEWLLVEGVSGADLASDTGAAMTGYRAGYAGAGAASGDVAQALDEIVLATRAGLCKGGDDSDRFSEFVAQLGPGKIIFPRGAVLRLNYGLLEDVADLTLEGYGAMVSIEGSAPDSGNAGLRMLGTCTNIRIFGFTFVGDDDPVACVNQKHSGLWMPSGTVVNGLEVAHFKIRHAMIGLSINSNLSGSHRDVHIHHGVIEDIYGTESGQGYGLHRADHNFDVGANFHAHHLRIARTERHAIYQARGSGFTYEDITIDGHRSRSGIANGTFLPAVNIIRSTSGVVRNIVGKNIYDGFVNIEKAAIACDDIVVDGARVYGIGNVVSPFKVGASNPTGLDPDTGTAVGSPGRVTLRRCHAEYTADGPRASVRPFIVYNGEDVVLEDNTCKIDGNASVNEMIRLYGAGGDTYSTRVTLSRNRAVMSGSANTRVIRLDSEFCTSNIELIDDSNGGQFSDVRVLPVAAITNPKIQSFGGRQSGYAMSPGVFLVSTGQAGENAVPYRRSVSHAAYNLSAGETVATTLSVPGVKAGDPVQVSMPNIGSLNVQVSAQAVADGSVRVVISNMANASVSISAGTATVFGLRG